MSPFNGWNLEVLNKLTIYEKDLKGVRLVDIWDYLSFVDKTTKLWISAYQMHYDMSQTPSQAHMS